MFYMNFILLMFMSSSMMFYYYYKHILLTLISLEFMMTNLFMNMLFLFNMMNLNEFFISIMMTIMICEGIMGLSILVYLIRMTGNDFIKSMNLLKW